MINAKEINERIYVIFVELFLHYWQDMQRALHYGYQQNILALPSE